MRLLVRFQRCEEMALNFDAESFLFSCRLPPPEQYEMATVLVFDVVGYTKRCAQMTATDVAKWMTDLHMAVRISIRKNKK